MNLPQYRLLAALAPGRGERPRWCTRSRLRSLRPERDRWAQYEAALIALAADGHVELREAPPAGVGRTRIEYRLTRTGVAELRRYTPDALSRLLRERQAARASS